MSNRSDISIAQQQLVPLPERVLWWPARQTLLLADMHLGKAATFRAAGLPVPGGTTASDLDRLDVVVRKWKAQRLIILGDMFHSRAGRAEPMHAAFANWRAHYPELKLLLIRGNHDLHAGDPPVEWNVITHDAPFYEPPFVFAHHPQPHEGGYVLAGHLHPAVRLGSRRQQLTLPCFWFGSQVGVLPAFGSFTGTATITPALGDRVFALAEDTILDVTRNAV